MIARLWTDPNGTAADVFFIAAAVCAVIAIALRYAGREPDQTLYNAAVALLALGLLAR